jgi:hypothetical protein
VFRQVEDYAIYVLELPFRVDAGIARQLHEEFTAMLLDFPLGGGRIFDQETKVMQSRPVRATPATFGSFGEMQQCEIPSESEMAFPIGASTFLRRLRPNTPW